VGSGSPVNCFVPKPKILVVDDHPFSRMTAVTLLSMEGYEVIEAIDGPSALAQVKVDDEVCRQLKQNEQTRLLPIIFLTALNDRRARLKGIEAGGDDFLSKPFDQLELSARVRSLVQQRRLNQDLDHAGQVLFSLARTVESRDPNTGDHCERLMQSGRAFGEFLHLSAPEIQNLIWASYLHDIGKIGIPDAILLKTAALTIEEQAIMQRHVLLGEQICQPLRTMQGVLPIIRHHHERWDGSGYPDGLVGDQIPFLVQVFQMIDIYDALCHERPYKLAFSTQESLQIMQTEVERGWRNPILMQRFIEFVGSHQLAA
jgi:putative two-component system response regulator